MLNKINSNATIVASSSTNSKVAKSNKIREKIRIARVNSKTKVVITAKEKASLKSRNLTAKVIQFKQGKLSRRQFISEITWLVLYIPKKFGCYDYDERYDFYAKVISEIDSIVNYYIPSKHVPFENWLVWFLKKRFITFLKSNKTQFVIVQDDEIIDNCSDSQNDDFNRFYDIYQNLDLSRLTLQEEDLIKAKYGIFDNVDNELARRVIEAQFEKNKLVESIAKKYCRLIEIQKNIAGEIEPSKIKLLKQKEQAVRNRKRLLEKSLNSLRDFNSVRNLANHYDMSKNKVIKYLNNAENKIYADNINKVF